MCLPTFCSPCKAIAPQYQELASRNPDVVFVKVDVDRCQDLTDKYEVSAMPTFKFIKNNDVVDTVRGADAAAIAAAVKNHKVVLQTVAFGAGASSAPSQDEPMQLNTEQIEAVLNFLQVAEMATHEQAAAALAEHSWNLQEAATAFFTDVTAARWQNLSSVSAAVAAAGGEVGEAAAEVKVQVRLGADGRDKHAVQLAGSATGSDLLAKLKQLLPEGEPFTAKLRVAAAKADFALGPGDMACALPALGLSRRGLVHVIPANDDPDHIKVLKKL